MNNTIDVKDLHGYNVRDKFLISNNKLFQLSSEKRFNEKHDNKDCFLIVKLSDSQSIFYEMIPEDTQQIAIQLEQFKINEKIAKAQIEKISSINAKLTFFVVLTIINIVLSIILAFK